MDTAQTEKLKALALAATPTKLSVVMLALRNARDVAMRNMIEARIPECRDFSQIAQNLDWAINEMERAEAAMPQQSDATRCRAEGGNTSQVGCERDDGLLNIHAESETCEVCSAPAAGTDKDAERIDWFEKMLRERGAVWMMPSGEELRFVQVRTPGECWNGPTVSGLRKAIDAAILAHTKAREGA